ncbi:carbon storage regulator [Gilvimarinus algae]|uniref:Carbon storage regulator n=1 Tax=Gilvimarinus algae TaxID=3058037 RepID=A0ABT8TMH7_9GAMM|nr:carbon storage regulator [Gilvimarinus sp. SDUM040014]MDO3383846.1 carbon storage regulator [Gilvimarinus sp. SDUM040014]
MEIFTRTIDETIVVETKQGKVELTVTDVDKGQVKIGIKAPKIISILREEIKDQKRGLKKP